MFHKCIYFPTLFVCGFFFYLFCDDIYSHGKTVYSEYKITVNLKDTQQNIKGLSLASRLTYFLLPAKMSKS